MYLPPIAHLNRLLDAGRGLEVHPLIDNLLAEPLPENWLLAIRALRQLGADRASDALALRVARRWPEHGKARLEGLRAVTSRSPLAGWHALRRWPREEDATPTLRAERLSLEGRWLAALRDESAAMALHEKALALSPGMPWLWVEQSSTLAHLDRLQEALAAARQALAISPGYRTALLQVSRLLHSLQRPDEARDLLQDPLQATGNGAFALQLFAMADDEQRHEEGLRLLDAAEAGLPRAEASVKAYLAARRADMWLALGQYPQARVQAVSVPGTGFYSRLAERLVGPEAPVPARVLIPLPMVRQHWMTCAPATLTSLARWWGRSADHVEVALAICYDGTPQASERAWAASQGFFVRECKLDEPTAHALLDAGVPFALATQHVGGGHLQAVVGYDRLRGTLLVRDPGQALHAEYEAEPLFRDQQSSGPRALVLLPEEEAHRLNGIELPESGAWDHGHGLLLALQRHDRPSAVAALQALEAEFPDSDSALRGRRHLALYDGDEPRILAATEALLQRYPLDRNLHLSRLSSLLEVHGEAAADTYLLELVAQPNPDPLLLSRHASRLMQDARRSPEAMAMLRCALRRDGTCSAAWAELGALLWNTRGAAAAVEPLRWASTLQPTDERAAEDYARACRVSGQAEAGLEWLRQRDRTWGDRSGRPAITLAEELDVWHEDAQARAVLDAALVRRPGDGTLRLAMAQRALYAGQLDEAQSLIDGCADVHAPTLLRVQAQCHELRGALDLALQAAEEAVQLEPLNPGAHRLLLRLLRRCHGHAEALARWRPQVDAHPAHFGLQRMLYDSLPDAPAAINAQLDRLQAHHPGVAWLQRERAKQASLQGRHDEALALAEHAVELAPGQAVSHDVLAFCVHRRSGRTAAEPYLRAALMRDVECESALRRWLQAADPGHAAATFEFVADEFRRQALLGDGLLTLQQIVGGTAQGEPLLHLLEELRERWPGLWHGPVAQAMQLSQMQRDKEALLLLRAAAERFTATPRVHLELARALRHQGLIEEAMGACGRALRLAPGWNAALRLQVDLLTDHRADLAAADTLLDRALHGREAWDDADLHGLHAWLLRQQQRDEAALDAARQSLRLDAGADWVWNLARQSCMRLERPAAFDALLEDILASRPGDAEAWRVRAQNDRDDLRGLAAAEKAIALAPTNIAAWQARFERLLRLGRAEEGIGLFTQPLPWPETAPVPVRAWLPRLMWAAGKRSDAVARLVELKASSPHDAELCRLLADWLDENGDGVGYLEKAEALVRLEPMDARSHAYLGHALIKNRRHADALALLQRATELAPQYVFAVRQLVEAAREAGQPERALPALEALWPHLNDVTTACEAIEVAAAAGLRDEAFAWLYRLSETGEEYDMDRSRAALKACRAAGWSKEITRWQRAHVSRGAGPAGVALDWLDGKGRMFPGGAFLAGMARLRATPGPHLGLALLHRLVAHDAWLQLPLLLAVHGNTLRRHDATWAQTSFALMRLGWLRKVPRWLRDWRERERPPSYALANLANSLACGRHWMALEEVVLHTLERQPQQEDMRKWELLLMARQGRLDDLRLALERTHEWVPDLWMRGPIDAVRAFAALAQARGSGGTVAALRRIDGMERGGRALCGELRRVARRAHTPWTRMHLWWLPPGLMRETPG